MLEQQKVTVTVLSMNVEEGSIYGMLRVNGDLKFYHADDTIINGIKFNVKEILGGNNYKETLSTLSVESVQNAIARYRAQLQ